MPMRSRAVNTELQGRREQMQLDSKALNDELIGDFVNVEINADMPVSTLYALEVIFYLRLQLAQVGWEDDEPIYEALCRNRFEQLLQALTKKYATASSVSEKIEILNRLEVISLTLNLGHNDLVLFERQEMLESESLTYTQRYRLEHLLDFYSDTIEDDIDRLLSEAKTSFDISILFDIDSLGTDEQYSVVMDLYKSMFSKAIAERNTGEIANLLAAAAYCNINPGRRQEIKEITSSLAALPSDIIPLPERCVNEIAATVYVQIDKITGKYDFVEEIPA